MVHFRCAPGWPWQAVDITIAGATHRTQCGLVEVVLVGHVLFQALGRLTGVADGPHATVEFTGDVLDDRFIAFNGNIAEHAIGETELVRKQLHDFMIDLGVEQRLYYFFSPLQRTVRRGYRAVGFELGGRGQQVGTLRTPSIHRDTGMPFSFIMALDLPFLSHTAKRPFR